MNYADEIIDFCLSNRVSTTEVADALGKSGVLSGVQPLTSNKYCVGKVRAVFTAYNSNFAVHEQIRDVQQGEVVIIFPHDCNNRAIIGDLITKYLLLYKRAAAVVVVGLVRDAARLRREGFAVWATGVTPLGCFNTPAETFPKDEMEKLIKAFDKGIAVCDDGGVTVISEAQISAEMLERLHRIEMQEDIWFFCLDTLKWDTKKIVCDKAYLQEQGLLSSVHIQQLNELNKPLDAK
jgi:regulator of RNase E activity RraA